LVAVSESGAQRQDFGDLDQIPEGAAEGGGLAADRRSIARKML